MTILIWVGIWFTFVTLNRIGFKILEVTNTGWRAFFGVSCFQIATVLLASALWFHWPS